MLYERFPALNTRSNDMALTFLTQGVFHTVAGFKDDDNAEDFKVISGFSSEIFARVVRGEG